MKKQYFLFLILIFCLSISGCSQKKVELKKEYNKDNVDFIFQQMLYKKYGKCSLPEPEKFYLSDFAYRLFTKKIITSEGEILLFEKYNPEFAGLFESSFFYDPSSDNGSYVEKAINYSDLEALIGNIDSSFDQDSFEDFDEDVFDQNKEIRLLDKDEKLRILKFESELFIPQSIGENLVFINSGKKYIRRNVYDDQFRLITAEKWNNDEKNLKRIAVENYTYFPDSVKINTKEILTDKQTEKFTYNLDGLVEKQELYNVSIVKNQRKETFVHSYSWNYDSQKRITYEGEVEIISGKRVSSSTSYIYRKDGVKPDTDYYENGVLKIRNRYTSNSNYSTTTYFEDEMYVQTFYENYKKVREIYYIGDLVLRENVYE